jgi:hypothetical protein
MARRALAALAVLAMLCAADAAGGGASAWSPLSILTQKTKKKTTSAGADSADACSNTGGARGAPQRRAGAPRRGAAAPPQRRRSGAAARCAAAALRGAPPGAPRMRQPRLRQLPRQRPQPAGAQGSCGPTLGRPSNQPPLRRAPRPVNPSPPSHPRLPPPDLVTKPSLARVEVCSRSVAVSRNGGGAVTSSTTSSFKIPQVESTACAEAVTNGVKDICKGGDPVATITSMASTCASAMAEVQASSISGAEVKAGLVYPPNNASKSAYTTACTSGCANGQVTAEAFARASACAFSTQTRGCNAVKTTLSGQAYSSAFVSTNARAWSNACALGFGKASGQGEALAKTMVTVLARTFGEVVAKACSECDTCKCSPSALSLTYDSLKGASDTSAAAADGRFTMARAFSNAAATYCASDRSPKALQTSVQTAVSTLATMIADVYAKTTGSSSASGTALACAGGSVTTKIQVRRQQAGGVWGTAAGPGG